MYTTIKVNMEHVDIDNSVFGLSLSTCDIFVSLAIPTCHFSTFQAKARPTFHFYKNLDKSANFNCQVYSLVIWISEFSKLRMILIYLVHNKQ